MIGNYALYCILAVLFCMYNFIQNTQKLYYNNSIKNQEDVTAYSSYLR